MTCAFAHEAIFFIRKYNLEQNKDTIEPLFFNTSGTGP